MMSAAGRQAAEYASDERAATRVGRDQRRVDRTGQRRLIDVVILLLVAHGDSGQPGMGRRGIPLKPGIGHVDKHSTAAIVPAHRGKGLNVDVHFLGFGCRADSWRASRDSQNLIRRRHSAAQVLVNQIERIDRPTDAAAPENEQHHARDPPA